MRRLVLHVAAAICLAAAPAAAADPTFLLDLAAPTSANTQDVTFKVTAATTIPLNIVGSDLAGPATADIDLGVFANEQGAVAPVSISIPQGATPGTHWPDVPLARIVSAKLTVPDIALPGRYTGRLILTPKIGAQRVWKIVLVKDARPAALVVTPAGSVALAAVRCFVPSWILDCRGSPDDPGMLVQLQVQDKKGAGLQGVALLVGSTLKMPLPNLDLRQHVDTKLNGKAVDLFTPPKSGDRDIPVDGIGNIALAFHDLDPGEYTIPLKFTARNSADEQTQQTQQTVTVTLQVRNHVAWAVLTLLFAALVSFIATRVVTGMRQRAVLITRIRAMRPYWLAAEPPSAALIWLTAVLRQAEDLNADSVLSGQSDIETALTGAQATLDVLSRAREVRKRLEIIPNANVRARALWKLDSLVQRMPASSLRDADATQIKSDLDKLDGWATREKMEVEYWADLAPSIEALLSQFKAEGLPSDGARTWAAPFKNTLDTAMKTQPATLADKIDAETAYQRLSALWDLRNDSVHTADVLALGSNPPVEKVFAVLDDAMWKTLKDSSSCTVEGPSGDGCEAYDPVAFAIRIPDPDLAKSYLVGNKLVYDWNIELVDKKSRRIRNLRVRSTRPSITQYSPGPGTMKAKVEIAYNADKRPVAEQGEATEIAASSDFMARHIVKNADFWMFLGALFISVVSGVAAYALDPKFGSFKDYLTLFAWGASIDQSKNFVQLLTATKRS